MNEHVIYGVLGGRILLACLTAALACGVTGAPSPLRAQPTVTRPAPEPLNAATFFSLAHSSATVQSKAAQIAASRETRPEVQAFAQRMVNFRREQIPKLEGAAREKAIAIPTAKQFEHQVIIENLEPLDFLALSRRYAEFQVQALEQELEIYSGGEASPDESVRSLAVQAFPELRKLLEEARGMQRAVGP